MRVYLPSTLPALRAAIAVGELGPAPLTAFAVTPALREWYTAGDLEELEYAALLDAARASLRLLDLDPAAPPRRVVLAVDVPDDVVVPTPDLDRAVVRVGSIVSLRHLAAVHVDGEEAQDDVRAAADAVLGADLGSEQSAFVVDGAEGHELMWFAPQELADLLA